ncbi:hypothetical protein [Campylobacter gastrosuis]|uniref:Uncharacterized protein n=1 Tax=Campylobacter gastrosuis TaxID=2974576 RepID=A0ABT7HQS4_9BACT|nr:hypothetical protein [Campylobacter gastrosuis]MDL0088778.1 hypothetical protein [Campylobacter gastrosuis]
MDTKYLNLTPKAYDDYLELSRGDFKVVLDLFDDNDPHNFGEISTNAMLINLDSNGDALLDKNDKYFFNLKAKGYDKDGNLKIFRLSELVSGIDLLGFIKKPSEMENHSLNLMKAYNAHPAIKEHRIDIDGTDNRISYYNNNPYTIFKPEYRYERMSNEMLDELFGNLSDKDGWVKLDNLVFNDKSPYKNFAYAKQNLNGELMLDEFNTRSKFQDSNLSYTKEMKDKFLEFYDRYYATLDSFEQEKSKILNALKQHGDSQLSGKIEQLKSASLASLEREFEQMSGVDFSQRTLQKFKKMFSKNAKNTAELLQDTDSVVAMKREKNGSITLKFDSGRVLNVNELYYDTGEVRGEGKRLKLNLIRHDLKEQTINELVKISDNLAIKNEANGEILELSKLGIEFIRSLKNSFYIQLENGKSFVAKELYNVSYINSLFKDDLIKLEDKIYKKVNERV